MPTAHYDPSSGYIWITKGNDMDKPDYNRPPPLGGMKQYEPYDKFVPQQTEHNLFSALRALADMSGNLRSRLEAIHSAFTGDIHSRDGVAGEAPPLDGAFPLAIRHVQYVREDLTAIEGLANRLEALLPKE